MQENGHKYLQTQNELIYQSPTGGETKLSLDLPVRVRVSWWQEVITLRGQGGKIPLSPLNEENKKKVFLGFFEAWKKIAPQNAKKAAFNYIDGQKGFISVAVASCLLIFLPFSVALLNDSREQVLCTNLLRHSSVLGEMQVVKYKKKRKGHYLLTLRAVTPSGFEILGTDQLITEDEAAIPKSVPVVYVPDNPKCWTLTPSLQGKEPNWAKRRYFAASAFLFGLFMLGMSLWGLGWSFARWRQKRVYSADLKAMFGL